MDEAWLSWRMHADIRPRLIQHWDSGGSHRGVQDITLSQSTLLVKGFICSDKVHVFVPLGVQPTHVMPVHSRSP